MRLLVTRGKRFTAQNFHHMLENHAYAGICVYNRRTESKWHRVVKGRSVERTDEGLEKRPEGDWVVKPNAWSALIDLETFAKAQDRRKASKLAFVKMNGNKVHSNYLLTGLTFCGVCGGRMVGTTQRSGKGKKTRNRYYVCGTHHKGDHESCPKRYTVPAEVVEEHILGMIRKDLARLRDDEKLHEYVAAEVQRLGTGQLSKADRLQQLLADLDQKAARLRDHLQAVDAKTADMLGLYEEAKQLARERESIREKLEKSRNTRPKLPDVGTIRDRARKAFDHLDAVLSGGTIEEKRELIGLYVQRIEADPARQSVQISLYPALFTAVVVWARPLSGTQNLKCCLI